MIPLDTTLADALEAARGLLAEERRMSKRALITGVTGQDGSYLAEFLLDEGYEVFGMVRRASTENFERIAHLIDRITLVQADLLDQFSLVGRPRGVVAERGLQPRRAELRADVLEASPC